MDSAILLISCPDQKGIVAKITNFLYQNNGNIEHADQHIDSQTKTFFMRIEWSLLGFKIPKEKIKDAFSEIAKEFKIDFSLHFTETTPKVAIFTSRKLHCLYDLLLRHKAKQFNCELPLIISNHKEASKVAKDFEIKFVHFDKNKNNKAEIEAKEIEILKEEKIELIILARYGQIFTKKFVDCFKHRMINIHHSFLPAFIGRKPYEQAYRKGVKIIGATSHYLTEELDTGPIIEQDTVRISHRDSLQDLRIKGEDLEKIVLSRAIRWHLERKILIYNNKTVVFD